MSRMFLFAVLLVVVVACRSTRNVPGERTDIAPISPEELVQHLLAAPAPGPYYSARADVELRDGRTKRSFKAQMRSVHDSALWVSASALLGIDVGRVLLTTDSIYVLDNMGDRYFTGTLDQGLATFGVRADIRLFQQALHGGAIAFDPQGRYRAYVEDGSHVLSSRGTRRFLRNIDGTPPMDTLLLDSTDVDATWQLERTPRRLTTREAPLLKYWIDPGTLLVERILIIDLARQVQADVRYGSRNTAELGWVPSQVDIQITDTARTFHASLRLDRIALSGPLNLPFRIPEKYEPMDTISAPR